MTMAEVKIFELEANGGIEVARQVAELYGESFLSYLAQSQWDYFIEQLLQNDHLRDRVASACKHEYNCGRLRKRLEIDLLRDGKENVEIGEFGKAHKKWLEINQPSVYQELVNKGELKIYLARYDLRARVSANVCMNFAMRYVENAVPCECSPEWQPYILKLQSLAHDYIQQQCLVA